MLRLPVQAMDNPKAYPHRHRRLRHTISSAVPCTAWPAPKRTSSHGNAIAESGVRPPTPIYYTALYETWTDPLQRHTET